MTCKCSCKIKCGGSSYQEVVCKNCSKKWNRYVLGSFDWEYKDCYECFSKKLIEQFKESVNELK